MSIKQLSLVPLSPVQQMLVDLQRLGGDWDWLPEYVAKPLREKGKEGTVHLFHYELDRRTGKTAMLVEAIVEDLIRLSDPDFDFPGKRGDDPRRNLVNLVYVGESAQQIAFFKEKLYSRCPSLKYRGSWFELPNPNGSTHVHFCTPKTMLHGISNVMLYCTDNPSLPLQPLLNEVQWSPQARIVFMGTEDPDNPVPSSRTDAVRLKIPAGIVNPQLLLTYSNFKEWVND